MEIRHVYVEKSEALEAFDQGEYVFDSPERGMMVPVRRSDISDADEGTFFRMQREEWKNYTCKISDIFDGADRMNTIC